MRHAWRMSSPLHRGVRRPAPVVACLVVAIALGATVALGQVIGLTGGSVATADPRATRVHQSTSAPGEPMPFASRWVRVLDRLAARRSAAWAAGEPATLATVFAPGSQELAEDRGKLAGYLDRGMVVRLRMSFDVLAVTRRGAGDVSLLVTDRVASAYAVTAAGVAAPLPIDNPTCHRIALHRGSAGWRIAAIRLG